ncbi:Hypothetical protein FKW44_022566 [Caligus rogercresseyi]|uniref:Uncharacterized protein n=1 Tax=Caligus rogercresseyi TaxID=217165 RepID=A0A7T8GMK4_CALRO|nr:Hypothetical protein FKW44_022566 [Caligus rogercresseyi]
MKLWGNNQEKGCLHPLRRIKSTQVSGVSYLQRVDNSVMNNKIAERCFFAGGRLNSF